LCKPTAAQALPEVYFGVKQARKAGFLQAFAAKPNNGQDLAK
jgi:hypothetical protein